ncbi:MAG TPA: hypothetical protein VMH06_03230, partial [Thermodesulfovibrionales bacterium]|nr:hypothetical protein [Thermodesulfovibrionales bacterium]
VYQKIQDIAPGELESNENIRIFRGALSAETARDYFRKGEKVVASLILGHHIESRLKSFTSSLIGSSCLTLFDCLKALEEAGRITHYAKGLFQNLLRLRNRAIHEPTVISEKDFDAAIKDIAQLEDTL